MSKSQRKAKKCKIYTGNSGQQPITQASLLRRALQWFANENSFQDLPMHGNVGWTPFQLIRLAVLWAWSDCKTLTESFKDARQLELQLFNATAVNSFQGLMGALQKYTAPLM